MLGADNEASFCGELGRDSRRLSASATSVLWIGLFHPHPLRAKCLRLLEHQFHRLRAQIRRVASLGRPWACASICRAKMFRRQPPARVCCI